MTSIAARKRKLAQATPSLEHRVDRLFTIALNFNERFIAIETALARLTNPAAPPRRSSTKKSVAASD